MPVKKPTEEIKKITGTVTLYKGTGTSFDAELTVEMITKNVGRITRAVADYISSELTGQLILWMPEVTIIYLKSEDAIFQDDETQPLA